MKSAVINDDKVYFNGNEIKFKNPLVTITKAIEVIQKTGNWGYIETYLPHMSADGIERVVEIYNSKHINVSEHKKACDYIKK